MLNHSTIRAVAERYTRGGLSVLPIRTDGTKAPALQSWAELQSRIGTPNELDEWFSNGVGIGVVGGIGSGNLEVLDFDKPGIFERFMVDVEAITPGLIAKLPHVSTPGLGHHLFLRCDDIAGNQKLALSADHTVLIETRGQGGYVVAPGSPASCHPSRRLYRHIGGPAIENVPTITPDERKTLLRVARSFDEREPQQQHVPEVTTRTERLGVSTGDDFAGRTSWNDILAPHGWTQVTDDYWRRPGKIAGVSASTKMTSKAGNELLVVFSSNAHPFEPDTSYGKFAAYAVLHHGGDFAAAASYLGSLGYGDQLPRHALRIPGTTAAATPFVNQRPRIEFERITAAELDSGDYSIEYLIEHTMTAGQPLIVAGGKKQLKTNVLLDAAISLATGGLFLGRLRVLRAARVAVMTGESGLGTIQETARRICKAKETELRNVEGLIFSSDLPRLDDVRYIDALERFVTDDEIEVVILDPAYLMMPGGDAGNLFVQGELLRNVSQRCEQLGVTMVLVHHTKKGVVDPYAPPELEHIAWAGFQEFARQWWLIGRRVPYEPGTGEHALWLNIGGSAGHSALWGVDINEGVYRGSGTREWDVELLSAAEAREESANRREGDRQAEKDARRRAAVAKCRDAVLTALIGLPKGATKRSLQDRTGHKGAHFDEALAELLRIGQLVETEITKANNQTYPGFKRVYPS